MMDYNEELIIDFLLNYEWATSHAITEKLNIKRPPDKNDIEEARLQLMRYYDAFDVVVKEEI